VILKIAQLKVNLNKVNPLRIKVHILLLFISTISFGQTHIFGIVKGHGEIISQANIVLKTDNNSQIIAYTTSNEKGYYEITTNKKGKFVLVVSALNYQPISIPTEQIEVAEKIEKNIALIYKPIELKQVIIVSERPITVKKDTVTFLAKSFLQGNEQVVEDLLKKIPGLNVTSDGTIKVGNEEVEKVMIDGDDFFEKGYKLLTKNMPASPIEKVELYQHYSNNKHLKGVENSEKIALNLKLKDDSKRIWFGNMQFGYGLISENCYEVRGNLMNFGKKNKHYILANLNNIGFDATGDINHLIRPFRFNEPASIGDNQTANTILGLQSETPNLRQKRINFNNAELLSLNSIYTISPKTKLKTLGFFNSDENDFFKNSFQSFTVGNVNFKNAEDIVGRKAKITGFGKIDLTHDISKTKTLEYTGKFNRTDEKNRSDLNFNGNNINEKLQSNNQLFDQKLVLTSKLKKNKVVLISGRYINEKTPQSYAVNQFIYQDLFNQNTNNIAQTSENKMQFAGFEAHLLDRKNNGELLEIQFGNQFRKDDLISHFQLKSNETVINEPLDYQNQLSYFTNDLYLIAKYRFKFNKISVLTQSDLHQLFNKAENFETSKIEKPLFINPKLGFEWEINNKNKILTSYSLNKTNATILDVYDNSIHTGFRSFSKGTSNFNQLDASSVLLNYTYGSWGDKFFANTFLLYSRNHNFFITNTLVAQNYSESEKILIKGRGFLTVSSNMDRYFKSISSNLKLTFGGSKSNYKNIVNNSDLREIRNSSLNYGFELRSGFSGFFNYHIGSKWNYSEVKTTVTNSFKDNMSFLDLSFMMSKKFNFQIQTERYYFGNLEKQYNKYYFMDLDIKYIVKENNLTFSLSGQNLFNTETFRNYAINDISVSKTEYKLQPRYMLIKMDFRF
jgi:hypothetical protein